MKKLILSWVLTVFLSVVLSGTASAANWVWVSSDEQTGMFFDSSSIKFERTGESINENIIYVWWYIQIDEAAAIHHPFRGKIVKRFVMYDKFDIRDQTVTDIDVVAYDKNEEVIDRGADGKTVRVIPGTKKETLMNAVASYAEKHKEEIVERSRK